MLLFGSRQANLILIAYASSESRGTFRQKTRTLAPLNGWTCAVEICHDGMLEDTNSLDGAHLWWCLISNAVYRYYNNHWARAWQNQQHVICTQRRLRSAWANEKSLGLFLPIKCTAKTDLTGRMCRLIWVFVGHTGHFVGFVMLHSYMKWSESRHEKTCFCHMQTTKAQISLCICAVWSAPLLFIAYGR